MDAEVPAGCDGIWLIPLVSATHEYDDLVEAHTFGGALRRLPTIDAALASASGLSAADKRWAYEKLAGMLEAQGKVAQNASWRAECEEWARAMRQRAASY